MCKEGCVGETGTDCDTTFRKGKKQNKCAAEATGGTCPALSTGALVGIIVGAVVGVALIGFVVYKFVLTKKPPAKGGAPDEGVTTTA
jgi:hypothetical protein